MPLVVIFCLILIFLYGRKSIRNLSRAVAVRVSRDAHNMAPKSTLRLIVSSWIAPTAVMAMFVAFSDVTRQQVQVLFSKPPRAINQDHVPLDQASLGKIPSEWEPQPAASDSAPDWIHQQDRTDGSVRHVVLTSKLWSTEAEALQEIEPQAAALVRDDFQSQHRELIVGPGRRWLSDAQILSSAIKKRYVEHIEQDFGTFSAPMYRVWLQVEISPIVRTEIYPVWKSAMLGNRTLVLGVVLSLMTLAANAVVLITRLQRIPLSGRQITGVVGTSAAAWTLTDLFVVLFLCR